IHRRLWQFFSRHPRRLAFVADRRVCVDRTLDHSFRHRLTGCVRVAIRPTAEEGKDGGWIVTDFYGDSTTVEPVLLAWIGHRTMNQGAALRIVFEPVFFRGNVSITLTRSVLRTCSFSTKGGLPCRSQNAQRQNSLAPSGWFLAAAEVPY